MTDFRLVRGDYWAHIRPHGRRRWCVSYGHGISNYREIGDRAWTFERAHEKATCRLERWYQRDEDNKRRLVSVVREKWGNNPKGDQ